MRPKHRKIRKLDSDPVKRCNEMSTKMLLEILNSWEIDVNEEDFQSKLQDIFEISDAISILTENLSKPLPFHIDENLVYIVEVLWTRLLPDAFLVDKFIDEIIDFSEDEGISIGQYTRKWEELMRFFRVNDYNSGHISRISKYDEISDWMLDYIEILHDNAISNTADFIILEEFIKDLDKIQWFDNGDDNYAYILCQQADVYSKLGKTTMSTQKYLEITNQFPDYPWGYIYWADMLADENHANENFHEEAIFHQIEDLLLIAQKIIHKSKFSEDYDVLLERFSYLYGCWGKHDKANEVHNEIEKLNENEDEDEDEDEDFEKIFELLASLIQKEIDDEQEIGVRLICYNCGLYYLISTDGIFIDQKYLKSNNFTKLPQKPENGKIIFPSEIICPTCSSNQFVVDDLSKSQLILRLTNKTSKKQEKKKKKKDVWNKDFDSCFVRPFKLTYSYNSKITSIWKMIKDAKKRCKRNPTDMKIRIRLGNLYRKLNYYDIAKGIFLKIIKKDSNNVEAYFNLGEIYLGRKDDRRAKYCFNKINKIDPSFIKKFMKNRYIDPRTINFIETLVSVDN